MRRPAIISLGSRLLEDIFASNYLKQSLHFKCVYFLCRNVYIESARIARGKLDRLVNLNVTSHSAVIFPGGFGAAKNL